MRFISETCVRHLQVATRCLAAAPSTSSRGFCGSTHTARSARRAVARLGLASEVEASTSEQVLSKMEAMALEVSSGALPSVVRGAAVQALVSMAALAAPLPALADDVPQLQPVGQAMAPQQMQVSGRVTYSRRAHDVFSPGR